MPLALETIHRIVAGCSSLNISDLSVDASEDKSHPNRMPFSGVLVTLDAPSDQPPHGSDGHLIQMPKEAAARRLRSLIGMGVNYAPELTDHAPRKKVGVITSAWLEGNAVRVKGHIWKHDFPEAVVDIKGKNGLGMSMELGEVRVRDTDEDVWILDDFQFTGATILKSGRAAYWQTSLAASADQGGNKDMDTKDKDKSQGELLTASIAAAVGQAVAPGMQSIADANVKVLAALEKLTSVVADSQTSIMAAVEALSVDVTAGGFPFDKKDEEKKDDAKDEDKKDDDEAAKDVEAKAIAAAAADKAKEDASKKRATTIATVAAAAATITRLQAQIDTLAAEKAETDRKLTDIQAQTERYAARVERKTMSPELSNLLEKGGVNISDVLAAGSGSVKPMLASEVDAAFERSGINLSPQDRIRFKNELSQAGALDEGIVNRRVQ